MDKTLILQIILTLITLLSTIAVIFRIRPQIDVDKSVAMLNTESVAAMATKARFDAEKRAAELEQRIILLEESLSRVAYRISFVAHLGEEPKVEEITIERIPILGKEKK